MSPFAASSILNDAFSAKFYCPAFSSYPQAPAYHVPLLNHIDVGQGNVHLILASLNTSKACGPYNVSALIIRECAAELSVPLVKLCTIAASRHISETMEAGEHHANKGVNQGRYRTMLVGCITL